MDANDFERRQERRRERSARRHEREDALHGCVVLAVYMCILFIIYALT